MHLVDRLLMQLLVIYMFRITCKLIISTLGAFQKIMILRDFSKGISNFRNSLNRFNPNTPDRFTSLLARCAENCRSALTHRIIWQKIGTFLI